MIRWVSWILLASHSFKQSRFARAFPRLSSPGLSLSRAVSSARHFPATVVSSPLRNLQLATPSLLLRAVTTSLLTASFATSASAATVNSALPETMSTETEVPPVEYFRADYAPPPYTIKHWDMNFNLDESNTLLTSTVQVHSLAAVTEQTCSDLVLDGEDIELVQLFVNDVELTPAQYEIKGYKLTIPGQVLFELCHGEKDDFVLKTVVRLHPDQNLQLSGLYKSGASSLLCTQCEAMGFRRITYSLDRPDVLSVFKVRLEGDKKKFPVLLSNGNHLEEGDIEGTDRHFAVWEDPFPKPSYLFALVAGDLASIHGVYTTTSGRVVQLGIYSDHANVDRLGHAMHSLKKSMKWDEDTFGLECDLDIYNVVATDDFNMGAMENKGLNIFNSAYVLADSKTATDTDFENILSVIGHEYFHNWTGNRVTVRDWFQLTLKEGLTVFRDQWFSSDLTSRAVKRIEDVKGLRGRQFAEDAGSMAHPIRPDSYISMDNFYTATVYSKGAEVIGIYKTLLGEDGFKRGLKLYFERHDGTAVTCDDFRRAMADANGMDLEQMERWYLQAGTPVVTVTQSYDESLQRFSLTASQYTPTTPGVGQSREEKRPVIIPLVTALLHPVSGEQIGSEQVLILKEQEQTFHFENVPVKPVVSTLRGFSAPVNLEIAQSDEELVLLMAHDTDSFNRWDASTRYFTHLILDLAKNHPSAAHVDVAAKIAEYQLPVTFIKAIETILQSVLDKGIHQVDCSLLGYALQLPDTVTLMNHLTEVDIDAVYHARVHVKKQLAVQLQSLFEAVYAATESTGEYAFTPQDVGRRRLHNTCLDYLAATGSESVARLAKKQFDSANCMTDKVAALTVLASLPGEARTAALQAFHQDAGDNALVLNKWFAIQGHADYAGILEDIQKLYQHPDFHLSNPNRARSLLASFGLGNHVHFHDKSGAGYLFLSDAILDLDKLNPQIAARLLTAFVQWKKFDAHRKALMKTQLERIKATAHLSPDAFEIVSRYLK